MKIKVFITHPMERKANKTKKNIVHVAKRLFTEISVNNATMNDIADAAKVSRRTLYMHFKNKDEIYKGVVENEVQTIIEKLQNVADSNLTPDRKLKLYILARFNVIDKLVRQNKYLRYDFIFNTRKVSYQRKLIDKRERIILERILQQGKAQGIFYISDPSTLANTLLIMCKSLEQPYIILSDRQRSYQSLIEYVNLLFNGILNNNSRY